MSDHPIIITCPKCGSPDVVSDAFVYWNIDTQDWGSPVALDNKTCNSCGYTGNIFYETILGEQTDAQETYLQTGEYIKPEA